MGEFPEKSSWCRDKQVCQGRKSLKRFEQANGPDTALYKNLPLHLLSIVTKSSETESNRIRPHDIVSI